jgi:hypothetical protein
MAGDRVAALRVGPRSSAGGLAFEWRDRYRGLLLLVPRPGLASPWPWPGLAAQVGVGITAFWLVR